MEALLPCLCWVKEATVELDDGRDMSWPMDGSLSSNGGVGGVLKAGRSNTCSIDGRRNDSLAWGLGRIEVASAEAVMNIRVEKRVALLEDASIVWRDRLSGESTSWSYMPKREETGDDGMSGLVLSE
jgi:hypothetical protein